MSGTVRGSIAGRKGTARIWPVLLALCALLVTAGCGARAGNMGDEPPLESDPIEEPEPPAPPETEEPAEEKLPPEEEASPDAGESGAEGSEEVPDTEETPGTTEAPNGGETSPGSSANTETSSASFTQEGLDKLVQEAIDSIITSDMTQLEQAKAVWDFTKGGIRYTGKSDKSDWQAGAYEGLSTRKGDCFTYYAVSRALLTALGIDNLEVQRVGGPTSHYWNLVNCGDGWYHFDATPRSSKMPYFVSFMFTDEEAADYTAKAGRNYYSFDGSLYPERAGGTAEEPAQQPAPAETPAPEAPPAENPASEAPPAEGPASEVPPVEDPAPEPPPVEDPAAEAPPADTNSEPVLPEETDNGLFPVDDEEIPSP